MGTLQQAMLMAKVAVGGASPAVVGQVLLYTGNGSAGHAITGADFSPDLVINKRRAGATGNGWPLTDTVRGATKRILSNATSSEGTDTDGVTSFDANGFTVGTGTNQYNQSGEDYMALVLQMVAGAFDIVTFSGTGSAQAINHNLGTVPELMFIRNRTSGVTDWAVYPGPLASPETKNLRLNTNAAVATSSTFWNNTSPSSTQFTVGTATQTNQSSTQEVAYLFASDGSGIDVGSYTGDGNTNGPLVSVPFKPKVLIAKRTDSTGNWFVCDDQRDPVSPHNTYNHLNVGGATAESVTSNSAGGVDFLSNGFQFIAANDTNMNINGATYVYLAIA